MAKVVLGVALIIGISMIVVGALFYFSNEKDRQLREKIRVSNEIKEDEKLQKEAREKTTNQLRLTLCLDSAYTAYKQRWDSSADSQGKLRSDLAESYDRDYKNFRDECYRRWY